jgi:uncharacterized membrane protein (UPF0127 family)
MCGWATLSESERRRWAVKIHRPDRFYVYNKTRETFVATEATVADGYFSRLIGLLGKTYRWARVGRGLWISRSRGVHTIGMLFSIDLIFLDQNKCVVHVEEYLRPFRISRVILKARSVLELPPHTIFRTNTHVGDELEIARVDEPVIVPADAVEVGR